MVAIGVVGSVGLFALGVSTLAHDAIIKGAEPWVGLVVQGFYFAVNATFLVGVVATWRGRKGRLVELRRQLRALHQLAPEDYEFREPDEAIASD
jgi:hypothetical protein